MDVCVFMCILRCKCVCACVCVRMRKPEVNPECHS